MQQKKCIPLTSAEAKYVTKTMEKARKSHATDILEMRNEKHSAFTAKERKSIGDEITHFERMIEAFDSINEKLYCIYSK